MKTMLFIVTLAVLTVASVNGGAVHIRTEKHRNRPTYPTGTTTHSSDILKKTSEAIYQCSEEGYFPQSGSCREFRYCEQHSETGRFNEYLLSCSLGTVFDRDSKICQNPLPVALLSVCETKGFVTNSQNELLGSGPETARGSDSKAKVKDGSHHIQRRQKRNLSTLATLALQKVAPIIINNVHKLIKDPKEETVLQNIENKLSGIEGNIRNIELTVLESQAENRIRSEIVNSLIVKNNETSQRLEVTQRLINQGLLEIRFNTAMLQGLIATNSAENERNFGKVQVSIGKMKEFINQQISSAKADIRKGFQSISNLIDQTHIKPLVSKMLTQITGFHQRLVHVQSLPEHSKGDEIERSGGFIKYLEDNTMHGDLYDIIHQNLAIPKDAADLQAIFILDLLVQGLQVHARMLSAILSSNVYLTGKALAERNLFQFNRYMSRVDSSIIKIKLELGYAGNRGLLQKVKAVIEKVYNLPYVNNIRGANELISDMRIAMDQLESDITSSIADNTQLNNPGIIKGKISFATSNVSTPTGPWQVNKQVSYAIQLVSENSLSKIGEWSTPYTVQSTACPIVMLPVVDYGLKRLIYRRFNDEQPELVAVINDHTQSMFRDIGRDLLNAAAKPNEDISIKETTRLLNNGADANVWVENKMTPLHYAAKHGNVKVMKLLVEGGADVHAKSSDNKQPLHFAALFGTDEGIEYLISKAADVNAQTKTLGLSALHIAVANNHVDATKGLIRMHAFINAKDNYGLTPLHMSNTGNGETMDVLLESATTNVNIAAEDGLTPLHYAARSTTEVFVQKLLRHKDADANILTGSQLAPLHFAAMNGHTIIMAELIQKGAVISARDEDGSTPLHYAAFYGNRNAALKLMEIDPTLAHVKNNDDKTPLNFAVENNRQSVIEVLQSDVDKLVQIIQQVLQNQNKTHQPILNESITISHHKTGGDCSQDLMDRIVISSEEICNYTQCMETYVNLVISMMPVEKHYENTQEFPQIFKNYDNDLRVWQEHTKVWRNGDSTFQGIRQTLELAREFELEFNKKYVINQERVKGINEYVIQDEHINQTKTEILRLQAELLSATAALSRIRSLDPSQVSVILSILRLSIDEKQRHLDEICNMQTDFSLILELEVLIAFLEFVRSDSSKINEVASRTKEKAETFRNNIENDKEAFERHFRIANQKFDELGYVLVQSYNELAALDGKHEELQKHIDKVNLSLKVCMTLEQELQALSSQAKTLLEATEKAIAGVEVIKDVFDNVTKKLTEMIDLAKTAKTETERMNAKFFIYNELSLLECNWKDVHRKVVSLDTCT